MIIKNILTLKQKALFKGGFFGLTWIVIGILQLFQFNTVLYALVVIALLATSVSSCIPFFVKAEHEDEMAEYNKNRAKAMVYDFLIIGISVCTLISFFKGLWIIDLKLVMPFVLGGVNIFDFIFFFVYEKVGA